MTDDTLKAKTARGLLWGLVNNGYMQVLNLLIGIILARALSSADYGLAGEILIFTAIAGNLQDSGFQQALINRRHPTPLDFSSVFWFNVSVSLLMFAILWLCAPLIAAFFKEPALVWLGRYAFLGFVVSSLCIVPRAMLQRQLRVREIALITLISMPVSGVVSIILALLGAGPWSLVTQSIVLVGCGALLSWRFSGFRPMLRFSWQPIRQMFTFSCKLLVTNIFLTLNNSVFALAFGRFYTKREVGTYTQADKWDKMGAQLISGMVQSVAQPMFVRMGDDGKRLLRAFRKMLRFTSLLAFPALLGLALCAKPLIIVSVGAKWLPSASLMQMLCVAGAFMPITALYQQFLISRQRSDVYMWNILAQGVLVLALLCAIRAFNIVLPLPFPLQGTHQLGGVQLMVLSYVVVYILWVLLWHHHLRRHIPLTLLHVLCDTLPFLLAALAAMAVAWALTRGITAPLLLLAIRIPVAVLLYVGIIYVSGAHILREAIDYLRHKPD